MNGEHTNKPAHGTEEPVSPHRWFRVHRWELKIEPVEVVKWTAHFVTYIDRSWGSKANQRREAKDGNYFDTWEGAHAAMLQRAQGEVERAKDSLHRAQSKLGQIKAMVKP